MIRVVDCIVQLDQDLLGLGFAVVHAEPTRGFWEEWEADEEAEREEALNGDRGAPGIAAASLPEEEAEADPALDCVAEDEHDSVDVDKSTTEVDWYDLVH